MRGVDYGCYCKPVRSLCNPVSVGGAQNLLLELVSGVVALALGPCPRSEANSLEAFQVNQLLTPTPTLSRNYQTEFYNLVGYKGNSALLVSAIYGLMGVLGQVINITMVADKRGRKTTMCKLPCGLQSSDMDLTDFL